MGSPNFPRFPRLLVGDSDNGIAANSVPVLPNGFIPAFGFPPLLMAPGATGIGSHHSPLLHVSPWAAALPPSLLELDRLFLEARLQALNRGSLIFPMPYSQSMLNDLSRRPATRAVVAEEPTEGHALRPPVLANPVVSMTNDQEDRNEDVRHDQQPNLNSVPVVPRRPRRRPRKRASPSATDQVWEKMFDRLVAYRNNNGGSCLVKEKDEPKLGRWIRNQRKFKRRGCLSRGRVERLNSIGFVWKTTYEETWEVMFQRLVEYKAKHGDCLVKRTYREDPKLGRWVDTQRNRDKEEMGPERVQRLRDIGFVWNVHDQTWNSMFQRLVKFKEDYGHCMVPSVYKEDPKLGSWVHVQRSRQSILEPERKERLENIGFVWCVVDRKV